MSLTSQLKRTSSPLRQFFAKYEHREGARQCLALLQSTIPLRPLAFIPSTSVVYSFMGTTADYLIRYTAFGNNLIFSDTIAEKSLRAAEWRFLTTEADDMVPYLENLYKIAKRYLDGRNATDHKAIYSAVALAVMDHFYRSGYLPRLFYEPIRRSKKIRIQSGMALT